MPFTEEQPKNLMGCKNRVCPFQALFVDNVKGKKFLKYQCSSAEKYVICLRWVDPKSHTEKPAATPEPVPEPTPAPATEQPQRREMADLDKQEQPKKQELSQAEKEKHRCNRYAYDCYLCAPKTQNNCGIEEQYRKPPA